MGVRFQPGQVPVSPGRPRIPEWLRGRTDDLLKLQLRAAEEGVLPVSALKPGGDASLVRVPVKERIMALDSLLDRLMGRAPIAADPTEGSETIAQVLVRLATAEPPR